MRIISYAKTVTFWVPLLCLMLSCTLTAHALSVHADSQLSAEGHGLCFRPPTDLSKFEICCTCDNLQEAHEHAQHAKRYYEAHKQGFGGSLPHWLLGKKKWFKYQKEHLRQVEKSYNMVKACLAEFKKKRCAPYQIDLGRDWCNHAGAVHQDVPGCGRVCSDATHRGVKNKHIWLPIANVPCSACPGAQWPGCAAGGHGRRLLLDPTNEDEFRLDEGATTDLQSSVKDTVGFSACPTWGFYF